MSEQAHSVECEQEKFSDADYKAQVRAIFIELNKTFSNCSDTSKPFPLLEARGQILDFATKTINEQGDSPIDPNRVSRRLLIKVCEFPLSVNTERLTEEFFVATETKRARRRLLRESLDVDKLDLITIKQHGILLYPKYLIKNYNYETEKGDVYIYIPWLSLDIHEKAFDLLRSSRDAQEFEFFKEILKLTYLFRQDQQCYRANLSVEDLVALERATGLLEYRALSETDRQRLKKIRNLLAEFQIDDFVIDTRNREISRNLEAI